MNNPAASNGTSAPRGKKNSRPVQQIPGLLTLSKPIDSSDASDDNGVTRGNTGKARRKKASATTPKPTNSASEGATSRPQRKKKANGKAVEEVKADEGALSRSAPSSRTDSQWDMPQGKKTADTASNALTWQQQMLSTQASPNPVNFDKKKPVKKDKGSSNTNKQKSQPARDDSKEGLTWQQELFGSSKPHGPAFDVFADSKDAETFGGAGSVGHSNMMNGKSGKKKTSARPRADSVGELDLHSAKGKGNHAKKGTNTGSSIHFGNGSASSSSTGPPSTPNKLAYAGPNFHNSPSPASLPVPKFLQSKAAGSAGISASATSNSSLFAREAQQHQTSMTSALQDPDASVSSTSSTSSDDEDHSFSNSIGLGAGSRYARGVTAPPDLPSGSDREGIAVGAAGDANRDMTIENLLAKLMRPGSD